MRIFTLVLFYCVTALFLFSASGQNYVRAEDTPAPKSDRGREFSERRRRSESESPKENTGLPKTDSERTKSAAGPPRRSRPSRGRTVLSKELFGEAHPESPPAASTVLGGTVPAIWEIEQSSPAWDDENIPSLLERDTLAPPVPGKVIRYAALILQHYDTDGDGILQSEEWKKMPGAPQSIDIDGDSTISLEELVRFFALYGQDRTIHRPEPVGKYHQLTVQSSQFQLFKPISPPAPETVKETDKKDAAAEDKTKGTDVSENDLPDEDTPLDDAVYEEMIAGRKIPKGKKYYTPPETLRGVPPWFIVRDSDGDGQVSLLEFAPTLTPSALAVFGKLDQNGDGFITPDEVRTAKRPAK